MHVVLMNVMLPYADPRFRGTTGAVHESAGVSRRILAFCPASKKSRSQQHK